MLEYAVKYTKVEQFYTNQNSHDIMLSLGLNLGIIDLFVTLSDLRGVINCRSNGVSLNSWLWIAKLHVKIAVMVIVTWIVLIIAMDLPTTEWIIFTHGYNNLDNICVPLFMTEIQQMPGTLWKGNMLTVDTLKIT